jgi:hypothetical protein
VLHRNSSSWKWQAALILLPTLLLIAAAIVGWRAVDAMVLTQIRAEAQLLAERRASELDRTLMALVEQHPVPAVFDDPPVPPGRAVEVEDWRADRPDSQACRTSTGLPTALLASFRAFEKLPTEAREAEMGKLRHAALYEQPCSVSPQIMQRMDPHDGTRWRADWEHCVRAQRYLRESRPPAAVSVGFTLQSDPGRGDRPPSKDDLFWLFGRAGGEVGMVDSRLLEQALRSERTVINGAPALLLRQLLDGTAEGMVLEVRIGPQVTRPVPGSVLAENSVLAVSDGRIPVSVIAAQPDVLRQRGDRFRFGLLGIVGLAILSPLAGLWLLRRGFERERALSEMKTNFIASVTHELRSPVASLQLLAEGLENGTVHTEDKRQSYFRLLIDECRRLAGLIANVLDVSRIERGKREFHREDTALQ